MRRYLQKSHVLISITGTDLECCHANPVFYPCPPVCYSSPAILLSMPLDLLFSLSHSTIHATPSTNYNSCENCILCSDNRFAGFPAIKVFFFSKNSPFLQLTFLIQAFQVLLFLAGRACFLLHHFHISTTFSPTSSLNLSTTSTSCLLSSWHLLGASNALINHYHPFQAASHQVLLRKYLSLPSSRKSPLRSAWPPSTED